MFFFCHDYMTSYLCRFYYRCCLSTLENYHWWDYNLSVQIRKPGQVLWTRNRPFSLDAVTITSRIIFVLPQLLLVTKKFVHSVACPSTAVLWITEMPSFRFRSLKLFGTTLVPDELVQLSPFTMCLCCLILYAHSVYFWVLSLYMSRVFVELGTTVFIIHVMFFVLSANVWRAFGNDLDRSCCFCELQAVRSCELSLDSVVLIHHSTTKYPSCAVHGSEELLHH
jgi:hypothetical protein